MKNKKEYVILKIDDSCIKQTSKMEVLIVQSDYTLGIREDDLEQLIMDIVSYADKVSELFEKIDLEMEKLPESIKCDANMQIKEKYNSIKKNYDTIHDNIISYSDDLVNLKAHVTEGINQAQTLVESGTQEIFSWKGGARIDGI